MNESINGLIEEERGQKRNENPGPSVGLSRYRK